MEDQLLAYYRLFTSRINFEIDGPDTVEHDNLLYTFPYGSAELEKSIAISVATKEDLLLAQCINPRRIP
jgi:hypothetical protein